MFRPAVSKIRMGIAPSSSLARMTGGRMHPAAFSASLVSDIQSMHQRSSSTKAQPSSLPPLENIPLVGGESDGRLVVLGTGWGAFNLAQRLFQHYKYKDEVRIVSPANHFLFTPLLPSTAVGTLEFRCIEEPIRKVLKGYPDARYVQAKAQYVDPDEKVILCQSTMKRFNAASLLPAGSDGESAAKTTTNASEWFKIKYDQLVISVGVKTNTFGIPTIQEGNGVYFLKNLYHARQVRNNIIDCFENAEIPGMSDAERKRLLSFVIVGGGPTSCEFAAELYDFVTNDAISLYPAMMKHVTVSVVEAGPALLGPFDQQLQQYTKGLFEKRDIKVRLGTSVIGIEDYDGHDGDNDDGARFRFQARRAMLSDGTTLPFGTLVWSAGLAPINLIKNCKEAGTLPTARNGRILVDEYLRVKGHEGTIWAMGDSAMCEEKPVPQLAQVARQQGLYLADVFAKGQNRAPAKSQKSDGTASASVPPPPSYKPFEFFSLGSMASLGEFKGVYDGSHVGKPGEEVQVGRITGYIALFMWRFAYWGRQTSIENKISIPFHWFKSFLFGRDVSRF